MAAAGWYPDPTRAHVLRWHDGAAWTAHVYADGRRTADPRGAPEAVLPAPTGDDVWLPPPGLPDAKRFGPFAVGVPSGGPGNVPTGGYEPVLTGNRALDLTQNYVNEFESQLRRDASLLQSSWRALRTARGLRSVGAVLGVLAVAAFIALGTAVYAAWDAEVAPFGFFFLVLALVVFALPAIYVVPNVVAFGVSVAAGLTESRTSAGGLLRRAWRARGPLGALALSRIAWWAPGMTPQVGAALYEAYAVLAVTAAIDAGLPLADAQRRSEELVAKRWGPGRFRALGLPQTSPWSIVYSRGVTRYGYKAPYLAALAFLVVVLGPLLAAVVSGNETWILAGFAWTWGVVAIGGLVWWSAVQPLLQGLMRAHLYRYARTGEAAPPFEEEALHACLREEARASFGLPQRRGKRAAPLGLGGVVRLFAADPSGFAQAESGLASGDLKAVIGDARKLYKDSKLVTRALEAAPRGLDARRLIAVTGLPAERCRTTVVNLVWTGKVRADVDAQGAARFTIEP